MSRSNKFFQHEDRASYELAFLLRALPQHLTGQADLTADQLQMAEAAQSHAINLNLTLQHGLESIGQLMYSAGTNEKLQMDRSHFASLGVLISELAIQLQFLDEFCASATELQHAPKGQAK